MQDRVGTGEPKSPDNDNRRHVRLHQILEPDAGSLPQSERIDQNQRLQFRTRSGADDQADGDPKQDHHVNVANSRFRRSGRFRAVQGW